MKQGKMGWLLLACGVGMAQAAYRPPLVVDTPSDLNRHLSPRCASLVDAMRSASRQGAYETYQNVRREFMRTCSEETQDALQQLRQEQDARNQRHEDERRDAAAAREQARVQAQQCEGLRDVIRSRRRREAELNPAELTALHQTEASYNQRCLGR